MDRTILIPELKRIFQFASVGVIIAILNIAVLYTLTSILGLYYILSAILMYHITLLLSFLLNDKFTFKSITNHKLGNRWHRFGSYYCVAIGGLIFYTAILFILTEYGNLFYLVSSIISTLLVFLWNYSVNKKVTWSDKK